jgi:hypothetical protein
MEASSREVEKLPPSARRKKEGKLVVPRGVVRLMTPLSASAP